MNPSHPNWLRITPLHRFAEAGDVENAAIFIDHGADLNARDEEFRSTPLGYAAKYGKRRMVAFLLRRGAKPNLPDDPPWATPLAWATRRGHDRIVRLLKQYEEDGPLPPVPSLEQYESLASDLVAAYNTGGAAAAQRIAEYFEIDPRTWNTGQSILDAAPRAGTPRQAIRPPAGRRQPHSRRRPIACRQVGRLQELARAGGTDRGVASVGGRRVGGGDIID